MYRHLILLASVAAYVHSVQVTVEEGTLEGQTLENKYGKPYHSFEGIPYAVPPLGDLRFKPPQPIQPWSGVKQANQTGSMCFQYNLFVVPYPPPEGSEDCLYMNIYSPNVTTDQPYPVMFWIHGGGFVSGSGDEYKPDFLIRKDVVLVTFNYRLEVLGFLSLGTQDIPGNAGMKDQVAALSGTANSWWPNTYRARDRAIQLARQMGCNSTEDTEIYNFFKQQTVKDFVKSRIVVTYTQYAKESPNVYFGVVSERKFGDEEVFFQGDVYDVLRTGIHEGVEVINGYVEDEGTLYFATGTNIPRIFEQANQFLEFFVPEPLTLHCSSASGSW
ncbi:unnamed protein product [Leptosia nina]|uniref:Carboxylesterase type B domain-containing protein n=1 Tax=Leptosia nina TaxID=320188 RepID=A0AAV1J2H2_9NEOP